jgi:hypothetical protein
MNREQIGRLARLGLALTLSLAGMAFALPASGRPVHAGPAMLVGPPWISIEVPPNPYDPETRGAYLVVNTFHHGDAVSHPLTGTAEGLVNGKRQSLKLNFDKTARPGRFALRKQWPGEGPWVLVIRTGEAGDSDYQATAIVEIGSNGQLASVKVPTVQRDGWTVPRAVTAQEIEAALTARLAAAAPGARPAAAAQESAESRAR